MKESGDPRIDIVGDTLYTHPLAQNLTEDQCWELAKQSVWALENNGYEIEQPIDTEGNPAPVMKGPRRRSTRIVKRVSGTSAWETVEEL